MKKLEMAIAYFLMEVNIKDFKSKEFSMDKECTGGLLIQKLTKEINIKEDGLMVKCMVKENSNIQMDIL
jgi:hypothetical protein